MFVSWFFYYQPKNIVLKTILLGRFALHYFSVSYLLSRLISPWHRDIVSYGRGFQLGTFLQTLALNLVSRVVGLFVRVVTILFALFCFVLVILGGVLLFVLWYSLPFILIWKLV